MADLRTTIDLDVVARELECARRPSGGFDPTWYDELVTCAAIHAPLDRTTAARDRLVVTREAISRVASSGTITMRRLRTELHRRSQAFLRQSRQEFVLVTPLSCRFFPGLTRWAVDGWSLTFSDGVPRGFDRSFVPEREWSRYARGHLRMAHVRVRGRARTINEALETGLERLDFVRGIWNLALNRRLWSQLGPRENLPINQIRLGPIHTMHRPDGTPVSRDVWWYELFQARDDFEPRLEREWLAVGRQTKAVRAAIRETQLGRELRPIIVQYCRALDGGDHDVTLLHLWSLLEALTGTRFARSEVTIERVRFLDGEPVIGYVLEILRERRNRLAHAGVGGIEARKAALQLHRFVVALLDFAIALSGRFRTLDEFGQFLAMSSDARKLKSEIALRRKALKYRQNSLSGRRLIRK